MYYRLIGKKSEKVKNVIERGLVRRFAESIGDLHPIYFDEKTGKQSRYGRNIAPPTFPRVLDFGAVEGLELPEKGLIHGEQAYHYERPLFVGEEIYCYLKISDYKEKTGNSGWMGFLKVERCGEDSQQNVTFIETSTVIITEAVRKAMNS